MVLDETESVIGPTENGKCPRLRECWEKFEWLMVNTGKLIAMDAFADYRTYTMLSKTRKPVLMHLNTWAPPANKAPIDTFFILQLMKTGSMTSRGPAKSAPFVVVSTKNAITRKVEALDYICRVQFRIAPVQAYICIFQRH